MKNSCNSIVDQTESSHLVSQNTATQRRVKKSDSKEGDVYSKSYKKVNQI